MEEETHPTNVGIDVSKDWLNVVVLPSGETWRTENTAEKIGILTEKLEKLNPERIILEATGSYEHLVPSMLYLAKLPVCQVNPR